MNDHTDNKPHLTEDQQDALRTWSNVGRPGPAPEEPFVPDDWFMTERYKPMLAPIAFDLEVELDSEQVRLLTYGHEADAMEDKWNVFFDGRGSVHFLRSWTGFEMYRLELEGEQTDRMVARRLMFETDKDRVDWTPEGALHNLVEVLVFVLGIDPQAPEKMLARVFSNLERG